MWVNFNYSEKKAENLRRRKWIYWKEIKKKVIRVAERGREEKRERQEERENKRSTGETV